MNRLLPSLRLSQSASTPLCCCNGARQTACRQVGAAAGFSGCEEHAAAENQSVHRHTRFLNALAVLACSGSSPSLHALLSSSARSHCCSSGSMLSSAAPALTEEAHSYAHLDDLDETSKAGTGGAFLRSEQLPFHPYRQTILQVSDPIRPMEVGNPTLHSFSK